MYFLKKCQMQRFSRAYERGIQEVRLTRALQALGPEKVKVCVV